MLPNHDYDIRRVILFRIGIITGQYEKDGTCHALFDAAKQKVLVDVVDPINLSVELNGKHNVRINADCANSYDAMVVRGLNFKGNSDFQFEVFEQLSRSGVILVNSPAAIQLAESKFLTNLILKENGCPIPESLIVQKPDDVLWFLKKHRDIIAKPIYGFHGHGVIRVKECESDALDRIKALIHEYRCICLQKYIHNPNRDIRVFVVGNRIVSAIYRFANAFEWRTNIQSGGIPKPCTLTVEQQDIAIMASRCLGLDYTGVDIIEGPDRNYVLEVNGAPSWGGILRATGCNVAEHIISFVIEKLESRDS